MIRTYGLILGLLFAAALVACGDDDDTGAACPDNVTPGGSVSCACGDGGGRGIQLCKPNMKLSECDCSDAVAGRDGGGGSGGSSSTGSGSGGSKSGGSGGTTMSGGSGGSTTPKADAGNPQDSGTDSGKPSGPTVPMDGNQLSICVTGVDCNRGLDCYNTAAPGDGFCSKTCATDMDCMGITGGTYVCSQSTGICVIDCMGIDDKSCPEGMVCESTLGGGFPGTGGQNGGSGGAGGFPTTFRCGYPPEMGGTQGGAAAWTACSSPMSADCGMGLTCNGFGAGTSGSGYCTQSCMNDDACTMMPSSGDIDPTCEPMRMGGGGPGGPGGGGFPRTCILDCSMNENGCPDDMTCVTNMFFGTARCEFQ